MSFRVLDLVKPFEPLVPEVIAPERKVPFNQRVMWTGVTLLIFLVMSEVPLYGIASSDGSDPLLWLRMMLALNRGTLMELGITPIVSASMVFQLLLGTKLIHVDMTKKEDREQFQTAQKLFAIMLAVGQATVYVLTGMYGPPRTLGTGVCLLLVLQLVFAGIIVILLDELLQKGYGLGSGISLFTATNVCELVMWKAFAPTTSASGKGAEFDGAVVALFHLLGSRKDKKRALLEAFYRQNLPNMLQVLATVLVFFAVVYLQGVRVDLPVTSVRQRGAYIMYPIRLFYTSNTPIMLQSALSSNIFLISQMLFMRWPNNLFVKLLGSWGARGGSSQLYATSGLSYYIQPPTSFAEALVDPVKTVIYVTFVLGSCAVFSTTWIEISGTSPRDVAKQFKDQGLVIAGYRSTSAYKELKRIIPTAAALGGVAIGALSVISDMVGCLGSGTSILLSVTTIYGYYELAVKEGGFSKSVVSGYVDGI
ncbi:protein transport protein SEC61 alpha subunit [Metschnikowia bicuspidata var. bicuspidata NRRL YB-4993]|uniref:Protein transport protein SEC61 alpha subunit n=1 Tax=Metschnikowia bicuspidata var. bicuspidata NRRL YB-4993 TaxID=869754 RepID=A0A1A0HC74_9ASCO|nr:protein transport protein SEC61 alpha subunit [Metschnikowia bicuspidata var. bicuspidata NRRL YB-4993]OBA21477.1 protein transport protein SEC61 alpha subunit [Metschnikowia bicuspidata var. bicuspidata NRRL YB-4993]